MVLQDRWPLMAVVIQGRFHCMIIYFLYNLLILIATPMCDTLYNTQVSQSYAFLLHWFPFAFPHIVRIQ